MPKDVEISEGGPLMDPAGDAFQTMLAAARTKGEAALTVKPDTSTGEETPKDVKETPESSSEGNSKVEEKQVEEDEETDPDKMKNTIRGLKAELTRIRNQRSASEGEAQELKERLARMEGRLEEIKQEAPAKAAENSLKKLTDDKLTDLHTAYEDELADARVMARQAEREGDRQGIIEANQRIDNARKMLTLIKTENNHRVKESSRQAKEADDEQSRLGTELEHLFAEVFKAAPELADKESELWKAGEAEYKRLPTLTKKLGPLGELIATAAAISKNPHLIGKKSADKTVAKMLDNIEAAADKAFHKGGTAPRAGAAVKNYAINNQKDMADFEAEVSRVKMG